MLAISNGEKCLCLIKYLKSLGAVSVFLAFLGFDTRAISTIRFSASGVQ